MLRPHSKTADWISDVASQEHVSVLSGPFLDALCTNPDGCYVDATFGRGGHARGLLSRLSSQGRLLAIDRDPDAVAAGEQLARQDPRFSIEHAAFGDLEEVLGHADWEQTSGIGFDLGISSPQLGEPERGFSFQQEGPLDMRMDSTQGQPLADKLRKTSEKELSRIIRSYGEERFAGRIARAILQAHKEGALMTTVDLENICFHAVPKQARHSRIHPATRTFQALRIWVNDEINQLINGLNAAMRHLAPGGRLAVIAFHSIEDRHVRSLIEAEVNPCVCPPELPVCACGRTPTMRWIQKKPIRPSSEEVQHNPRSRSARMRVAEKLT